MCLYLHSNEQTGCLVCLQYKLADDLQEIHQPNFPLGIPTSFKIYGAYFSLSDYFLSMGDFSGSSPFFLFLLDFGTENSGIWLSSIAYCCSRSDASWP
jgi:hypothetical protein